MKLSVIVCTHNRAHQIIPCLNSIALSLAHAAPVDAEIVVVDNASDDNTSIIVQDWARSCSFPVNLAHEPRKGLSRARNCGIRESRGDLLVWTDDDCRLDVNHIATALRYDAADTAPVLRGGRVELGDPTDLPLSIKIENAAGRWQKNKHPPNVGELENAIIGANMTVPRSLIHKIGYFDERFGAGSSIPAGEETEFIIRAFLAGFLIEYVPDMTVYHFHGRKQNLAGRQLMRNYMVGAGGLYGKYLFNDVGLRRPGMRDVYLAFKEMLSGKNYYLPEADFSLKNMIGYWALGLSRYALAFNKRAY